MCDIITIFSLFSYKLLCVNKTQYNIHIIVSNVTSSEGITTPLVAQKCGPGRAVLQADASAILKTTRHGFDRNHRY